MVRLDRINGKGYRPSISFEKSGDEGIAPKGDNMKKADLIKMRQENVSNVIRHLVPLVVTDAQLDKGLQILDEVMAEKVE
jgi:4-aminobutyrate aminotransferase-like enzyme